MHITIAWRNHTFHLNEMLLLWNQWIDGNAAPLSVSLQGCVFVRHGRQAHISLTASGERRPSCSMIFFIWQSLLFVTDILRGEVSGRIKATRGRSQLVPANITDQPQSSKRQAKEAQSYDASIWCNYSPVYLRELLHHLINMTDIGEFEITGSSFVWL